MVGAYILPSSFPKVVVGNPLFAGVALSQNDRFPTKFLGDDTCFCFLFVVILESCSPGSVVTQKEENNGYWNAPRRQTFQYDFLDNNELPKM